MSTQIGQILFGVTGFFPTPATPVYSENNANEIWDGIGDSSSKVWIYLEGTQDIVKRYGYGVILKLGIQAAKGTVAYINGKRIIVGQSGVFELDESIEVNSLYFEKEYTQEIDEVKTAKSLNGGLYGFKDSFDLNTTIYDANSFEETKWQTEDPKVITVDGADYPLYDIVSKVDSAEIYHAYLKELSYYNVSTNEAISATTENYDFNPIYKDPYIEFTNGVIPFSQLLYDEAGNIYKIDTVTNVKYYVRLGLFFLDKWKAEKEKELDESPVGKAAHEANYWASKNLIQTAYSVNYERVYPIYIDGINNVYLNNTETMKKQENIIIDFLYNNEGGNGNAN